MSAEIVFLWVGKTAARYARAGEPEYLERIGRYRPARVISVRQERQGSRYSTRHRVEREGERLLERLDRLEPVTVVALDPDGRELGSRDFARRLQRTAFDGGRNLALVVGGPDGISLPVRKRADLTLGLSQMTFPHDMARLMILEQVYRALTIIHGHPYDR